MGEVPRSQKLFLIDTLFLQGGTANFTFPIVGHKNRASLKVEGHLPGRKRTLAQMPFFSCNPSHMLLKKT
jgi:hypothetical protein